MPDGRTKADILLVDDRPENLVALEAILEPLGQNLVRALSGVAALRHLLTRDFALILLDVQMPGMDGFETAALIKEREKTRHVPIIFITAISTDQKYVFRGYSAGAVDYIAKPFEPEILRSKVSVFVDLWEKGEQIRRQADLLRRSEQREAERELAEREREMERRHLDALAASEARLRRVIESNLIGILFWNTDGLITDANEVFLGMVGYSREDLVAERLKAPELTPPEYRPLDAMALEQLLDVGSCPPFEKEFVRSDGNRIPVLLGAAMLEGSREEGVSFVLDLTLRKAIEESFVAAKEEAERANRAKSDFISGVSHELRTPLNAIVGFSKLLKNPRVGPLNEDQAAYVQDIVQSAEHLQQLIDDILDLSKIEAGKMTLSPAPFSLAEVLEQSLVIVREKARQHSLGLHTEIAPEVAALPPFVADQRKVKQVLYNLLSNAVKFTPDGGRVVLRAVCEAPEPDKGKRGRKRRAPHGDGADAAPDPCPSVVVSVEDTGIGIAPEHQARIWENFEQVDSSYTRHQQGTGLGLALTRRLVEMHGGSIWLTSEVGRGSTFSFRLPLRLLNDQETAAGTAEGVMAA